MNLAQWSDVHEDTERSRRLAIGYGVGAVVVVAAMTLITLVKSGVPLLPADEEVMEIQLPQEVRIPEPEVKIEHAPKAPPRITKAIAAKAGAPPPDVPKEIPKEQPAEADGSPVASSDEDNPFENEGGGGRTKVVEAKKDVVERVPVAEQVFEKIVPPVVLSMVHPQYPASAMQAGIEGTVVIRYTVTEDGEVTDVRAITGPEELVDACIATVKTWKFSPAMLNAKPIAAGRVARFPFKIRSRFG